MAVIGASLVRSEDRKAVELWRGPFTPAAYERALMREYEAATGIKPPSRYALDAELVDQFTYKARNARGKRILEAAKVAA